MRKLMLGLTKLMVVDDLQPEDSAMLQALYSRSAESVETHLEKLKTTNSGKFMSSYYVGYGHKSIADCGSTTMFIENVSLLAAKAIQDWPLYSGQETSTRYIDMSKQRIVDPIATKESRAILDRWMTFYTDSQDTVAAHIRQRYPRKPDEKEEVYERAVKARTFDTLRGFLPAGITTQLSWHTNIRQAGDHLIGLTKHPVDEIRGIGQALRNLLGEQYPSSGAGLNLASVSGVSNKDAEAAKAREEWERMVTTQYAYFVAKSEFTRGWPHDKGWPYDNSLSMVLKSTVDCDHHRALVEARPRGCVLPHWMTQLGQLHIKFGLDFGSYRDLQRHRNGVVLMPLLVRRHGFEGWYLRELGPLESAARELVAQQTRDIEALTNDVFTQQYYTALGFIVPCVVTWSLPAAVYVMELRSTKYVHPTLRARVHEMIRLFGERHPNVPLHVDMDADDWTTRRGQQTITKVTSADRR